MVKPLDELYLEWLYRQAAPPKHPRRTYWRLFKQMLDTEFVWFIMNDDNRAQDGRDLRLEFAQETGLDIPDMWYELGCSVLEMLIAMSRRLAFDTGDIPEYWFWHMLENIDLVRCSDRAHWDMVEVEEIIERVIWRTYSYTGRGGLFPLSQDWGDQREVELWYQMGTYLLEREEV